MRDNITLYLTEIQCEDVTGFFWSRMGLNSRLLWME